MFINSSKAKASIVLSKSCICKHISAMQFEHISTKSSKKISRSNIFTLTNQITNEYEPSLIEIQSNFNLMNDKACPRKEIAL